MRQKGSVHFTKVPTCPTWASRIEVVHQGENLIVRGWKRWESYPCPRELPNGCDLLADYRAYAAGDRHITPLHLALVNATDDQQLEVFVREFGPLGEGAHFAKFNEDGTMNFTVFQSMGDLRYKQRLFRSLFELLVALRAKKGARVGGEIANCAMQVETLEVSAARGMMSELEELVCDVTAAAWRREWGAVHTAGHRVACHAFGLFTSQMVAYPDGVVELPRREPGGVFSEAMFMLKTDYEREYRWSFCKNENCQRAFRLARKDQTCCKPKCTSAVRSRKHYYRRGYEVRRARLAANESGTKRN